MKERLCVAIIGQGRSGKNIHGAYYRSERNVHFRVGYVVDRDPAMREIVKDLYPGAEILSDVSELYPKTDIDLCVNASYSNEHFPVTLDLLRRGFNVLTEKPMARTYFDCMTLIETAKESGARLFVFHNTQKAPFYLHAIEKMKDGTLGDVLEVGIRYNGFARRWDWQTLQKKLGGSAYNTGPHPFAMALGFLGGDPEAKVVYSKLVSTPLSSGDADDFVKAILTAPGKPLVDVEISASDAFPELTLKLQGTLGTLVSNPKSYKMKYIVEGENPPRDVVEKSLRDENGLPVYCREKLITHEESGDYQGTAFEVGTHGIYEDVYFALTEGREPEVSNGFAARVIGVIEQLHAENPLTLRIV